MSLLAPLYFFGAMAIGLPILFHLIRRRPKGEVEFSSLMFLRPTPPRLTRKSRLDNWPLLLIRALALMLLAAAFARPFLRSTAQSASDLPSRRTMLLIDTSASMQRVGVWQQAIDRAGEVIDDLRPGDQLAIVRYDRDPKLLLGFEQSDPLTLPQLKATAKELVSELKPTWQRTDTGRAVSFAADLAVSYEPEDAVGDPSADSENLSSLSGPAFMVLISDLQAGSQIESLQRYAWPDELRLSVQQVAPLEKTNASARILAAAAEETIEDKDRVRVRVVNSSDATEGRFQLAWSADGSDVESALPVQVPPGETRVIRMPTPRPGISSLVLTGDQHAFDNLRYLVSPQPQQLTLLHLGPAAVGEARGSLLYYLQRVPLSNPRRDVSVQSQVASEWTDPAENEAVPLVVVEDVLPDDAQQRLGRYVAAGGNVLVVLAGKTDLTDLASSVHGVVTEVEPEAVELGFQEAEIEDYAMLSKIDFGHPIFQPMADPQFNDFTKIRFWAHRKVVGMDEAWRVLASFDDGDPALMERRLGTGKLWLLTSGWQPAESQLALSTKFIPLVFSLFDAGGGRGLRDAYTLGETIDLKPSDKATITGPAGVTMKYAAAADLEGIDQPGIYQYDDEESSFAFAVNLDPGESRTEALGVTELERFGVTLGTQLNAQQLLARQRQLRDIELEKQQRLWQWLLVAALLLLALETWLGGWISRRRGQVMEPAWEA